MESNYNTFPLNETSSIALSPNEIRRTIVKLAYETGIGHLPSCFSIVEILTVLYTKILRIDPAHPKATDRDYFILSKGHAASAIFSTLGHRGFFPLEQLHATYGSYGSLFGCHPDRKKVPGVEASTGSLGHGMPFAVGVALGLKMRNKTNQVFTLIGDGESNEGSVWEAAMVAEHLGLNRLVCIVDLNNSQIRCLPIKQAAQKWEAFGWNTVEVDGHAMNELEGALKQVAQTSNNKPSVIIAHTIKGKGVTMLESDFFSWHHRSPTTEEYSQIMGELH